MPRDYKRTTNPESWSTESTKKAIEAVRDKKMGWLLVSKTFGLLQATLRRHVLGTNKNLESHSKGLGCWKATFPPDVERQLVVHIKFLESRLFGLTQKAVQELAFQMAEKNGFAHKFSMQKQKAEQEWLDGFLRRNKDISLRKPEATSAASAHAFNRPQVQKFYQLHGSLLESVGYKPHRIYNADESGLSTVQKPEKILATTGRKQVAVITSAERGANTTVDCCFYAIGTFVPPMMIFPRKKMKNELIDEAPPGTLGEAQPSDWMTTEIFLKWIKHFQSIEDKVILIVDGHASHKGIDTLEYAKEKGIHVICLPPHGTHRMQPLDVSFFGPLKTYFNQEISKWLKTHPGRVVTHLQIAGLFNEAYGKAVTVQNVRHEFKSTGIWPLNPDIFLGYMYEPAETTNIPLEVTSNEKTPPATLINSVESGQHLTPPSQQDDYISAINTSQVTPAVALPRDQPRSTKMLPEKNNTTEITASTDPLPDVSPQDATTNVQEIFLTASTTNERPSSSSLAVPFEVLSPSPKGRSISSQGKR